jgi:hypothetical protein
MNTNRHILVCLRFCVLIVAFQLCQQVSPANSPSPRPQKERDGQHDFDFNLGTWKIHVSRLVHPLTGSNQWLEYDGTSVVSKVWNGRASLFELDVSGPAGRIEGVGLRLYNPETHQWSLNWANSSDGVMNKPMIGDSRMVVANFSTRRNSMAE